MTEQTDIHSSPTESIPVPELDEPLAKRRPPSVTSLLANSVDWMQYDFSLHDQQAVAHHTSTMIALREVKTQIRHMAYAAFAIIVGLIILALLDVGMIYQLGRLIELR